MFYYPWEMYFPVCIPVRKMSLFIGLSEIMLLFVVRLPRNSTFLGETPNGDSALAYIYYVKLVLFLYV